MKKITKLLTATALSSVISTAALAQLSISGYVESSFITGETTGVAPASKTLGNESSVQFRTKGKMSNGMGYEAYQEFQSDHNASNERQITINVNPSLDVFYGFETVKGIEAIRSTIPFATNRLTDVTSVSGLTDVIDNTSGEHFVGFDLKNIGPGTLSVAYNPNGDSGANQSSDVVSANGTSALGTNGSYSGLSASYRAQVTPNILIGFGMLKGDAKNLTTAQDPKSKQAGIRFSAGDFAIGVQQHKNEGVAAAPQAGTVNDKVTQVSATYNLTKEITAGVAYGEQERTLGGTKDARDTEVRLVSIGYNLGPVVASVDYEKSENRVAGARTASATAGADADLVKLRVRANF
jgi:hypothetical protein